MDCVFNDNEITIGPHIPTQWPKLTVSPVKKNMNTSELINNIEYKIYVSFVR